MKNCFRFTTSGTCLAARRTLLVCLALFVLGSAVATEAKIKIVLVGDSTVTDTAGWGLGFKQFLTEQAECINTAQGGRSSLSFMQEGRWTNALAHKGDYYLVQFGHNNQPGKPGRSTDMATYVANLNQYVAEARAIGAKPVLVTPLTRRQWDKQHPGKIKSGLEPYAEEVRKIATEQRVPLVDLHARSIALCESLGPEKCLEFSPLKTVDGTNTYDGTHLAPSGHVLFARLVVEELRQAVPELAPVLRVTPVAVGSVAAASKPVACFSVAGSGSQVTVAAPNIPTNTISLADYGTADGVTLNTAAFAKAIAALTEQGGGKLIVPPGLWLTGPIQLRSRINLHLEAGAVVKFSGDHTLYPLTVINVRGEREVDSLAPISGQDLEDVAITGSGILDGGGNAWRPIKKAKLTESAWMELVRSGGVLNERGDVWWPSPAAVAGEKAVAELRQRGSLTPADYAPYHQFVRPKMLRLIGCKRLLIEGVTFQNPPNWTINPVLCEDVSILNVKVFNSRAAQNSDALDVESCRRAVIRGCIFDVGDDGICLKSGLNAAGRRIGVPTEDVLVEDCTVYFAHGGFTIGSEMSGGVRNVRVSNCTFIGTAIGLRFKSTRGRGGVVENIRIENVRMTDLVGDAINFNLFYGGKSPLEEEAGPGETKFPPVTEETPQFRDIHIENVICRNARGAITLQGLPEMPLRNITLKNVLITADRGVAVTDAEDITFAQVRVESRSGPPVQTVRVKNSRLELEK
ncbi:MAG: glycosyl hydrolase family 28 protein [Verrucomicrobiota bacterium]